jgi:CheY-like chemotaxis protein
MTNPDLRFVVYAQHDIPNELFGDEVRLRQVLLNVLTNALKYTKSGHFSLDITGERAVPGIIMLTMKIKDTGIGIKPEDMEKLFGEFNQFDLEKNRDVEGTGLGLAITNNLVRLMGGNIQVTSEYGVGSEFTITLPQKYNEQGSDWLPSFGEKTALLYGKTSVYTDYAARSLIDLGVNCHVVSDEKDLRIKLSENQWGYIFAEKELAQTAMSVAMSVSPHTVTVMMTDTFEARSDLLVLTTPAYFIPIASILSGKDVMSGEADHRVEFFTAPDAKILIVDDVETNLKVAEGLLKPYKVAVDVCFSGREAINAVQAVRYDLVLMDHMMPEMDGIEATKKIREIKTDLPIVALTANALVGVKEMFLKNGFNDFLSKPIDVSKLNDVLIKWIPKEKQAAADRAPEAHNEPMEIESIEGIDITKGIAMSGGNIQSYLDTLKIFHKDGKSKLRELADCVKNENTALYTTYVHALKSACANIGALQLSKEAGTLENAGINQDMSFILAQHDRLASELNKLLESIAAFLLAHTPKPDENLDITLLNSILDRLKTAMETFDITVIDETAEELQAFTAFPDVGEALNEILQNVFVGKYKKALAGIEALPLTQNLLGGV